MKKSIVIIMFLFFIGFTVKVYAETSIDQVNSTSDVNISKTGNINSELSEAQAYKLLYENQKESNQRILSTIYWALGVMLTTGITLIGGNIFNNYRLNNDKINKIALEFDGKFKELKTQNFSEIQEKLNDGIEKIKNESKSIINDNNKKINDNMINQDNKIREIKKEIRRNIVMEERRINELDAKYWEYEKIYQNSLVRYIWKGENELELNFDMKDTLNSIIGMLEKSVKMSGSYSIQLNELLAKIPEKYDTLKERIINLERNLPII